MMKNALDNVSMGGRVTLATNVPLDAPRCIRINPSTACNLRCQFCAISQAEYRKANPPCFLDFDEFKSMADDIKASFGKVKNIKLVGMGEPLTHPRFADMVAYLTEHNICEVSETITNGVPLTPSLSDALIASELDFLKISINGLSDEDYMKHCGVNVSFLELVENLRYFYSHKTKTKVYVKIINYMVEEEDKLQFFQNTFGPISDVLNVEKLITFDDVNINYDDFAPGVAESSGSPLFGENENVTICNLPFYNMRLCPGGYVTPCCNEGKSYALAKRNGRTLREIWQTEFYPFQRKMLDGFEHAAPFCRGCTNYTKAYRSEDNLEEAAAALKEKYDSVMQSSAFCKGKNKDKFPT